MRSSGNADQNRPGYRHLRFRVAEVQEPEHPQRREDVERLGSLPVVMGGSHSPP